jgi:hypothetical protein
MFKFHTAANSLWFGFIVKMVLAASMTTVSTINLAKPLMQ